jgi:cytochrome P450
MNEPSLSPAPGPDLRALLNRLPELRANPLKFIQQAINTYGDLVHFRLGGLHAFLVNHPDAIQHILQENNRSYTKDTLQYNALAAVTGKGLLTSDGETWLAHRRLMQPAFSRPRIYNFGPQMVAAAENMLDGWQAAAGNAQPLDVDQAMMRLALEILGKAVLGVDLEREAPALTEAVTIVLDHVVEQLKSPPAIPHFIPTRANRRYRSALGTLDQAVLEIIAAHRQEPHSTQGDLLDLMIQAGNTPGHPALNARQLRDEIVTILIAGHETVASALTWACFLLSQNPAAAARLRKELHQVLGGRRPEVADLPALTYTRRVFDEALRLYPPAWLITRKCVMADHIDGHAIPAGSLMVIGVAAVQRHPAFWPNPDCFDPDRFLPEQSAGRPHFAYLPFGGGPRLCIGNTFALTEAPLVLAAIYQRFRLELVPGTPVEALPLVTQRPSNGLPMLVYPVN